MLVHRVVYDSVGDYIKVNVYCEVSSHLHLHPILRPTPCVFQNTSYILRLSAYVVFMKHKLHILYILSFYVSWYVIILDFISLTLQKLSYHYLFYLDVCCSSNRHNFQFSVSTCNLLVVVADYTFSSSKESRDCGEVIQYTCKKKSFWCGIDSTHPLI